MTRVIITGAGGFIGSHLVADQLRRGREVTAVDLHTDRLQPLAEDARLRIATADFTNGAQMSSVVAGDYFRIKVTRDGISDTATGDAELVKVEIRET